MACRVYQGTTDDYAAGAESKLKRLSIVLSKFFSPKQGKLQAECTEAAEIDYVTRAESPPFDW